MYDAVGELDAQITKINEAEKAWLALHKALDVEAVKANASYWDDLTASIRDGAVTAWMHLTDVMSTLWTIVKDAVWRALGGDLIELLKLLPGVSEAFAALGAKIAAAQKERAAANAAHRAEMEKERTGELDAGKRELEAVRARVDQSTELGKAELKRAEEIYAAKVGLSNAYAAGQKTLTAEEEALAAKAAEFQKAREEAYKKTGNIIPAIAATQVAALEKTRVAALLTGKGMSDFEQAEYAAGKAYQAVTAILKDNSFEELAATAASAVDQLKEANDKACRGAIVTVKEYAALNKMMEEMALAAANAGKPLTEAQQTMLAMSRSAAASVASVSAWASAVKSMSDALHPVVKQIQVAAGQFNGLSEAQKASANTQKVLIPVIEAAYAASEKIPPKLQAWYLAQLQVNQAKQAEANALLKSKGLTLEMIETLTKAGMSETAIAMQYGVTVERLKAYGTQLGVTKTANDAWIASLRELRAAQWALADVKQERTPEIEAQRNLVLLEEQTAAKIAEIRSRYRQADVDLAGKSAAEITAIQQAGADRDKEIITALTAADVQAATIREQTSKAVSDKKRATAEATAAHEWALMDLTTARDQESAAYRADAAKRELEAVRARVDKTTQAGKDELARAQEIYAAKIQMIQVNEATIDKILQGRGVRSTAALKESMEREKAILDLMVANNKGSLDEQQAQRERYYDALDAMEGHAGTVTMERLSDRVRYEKAKLAQIVALYGEHSTQVIAQIDKIKEAERAAAGVMKVEWGAVLGSIGDEFMKLAQIAGGSLGSITKAIGTVIQTSKVAYDAGQQMKAGYQGWQAAGAGVANAQKKVDEAKAAGDEFAYQQATANLAAAKKGSTGAKVGAGVQMGLAAVQGIGAFQQAMQGETQAQRALAGAAAGASMGSMFGPWGTAIGAGIGALAGIIKKDPGWAQIQDRIKSNLGVAISDGTAKAIEASSKDFKNNWQAAEIFNLDKVIADAGGVKTANFDKLIGSLRDSFSMLETGKFTVEQTREVLDKNFGAFADHVVKSGKIASSSFLEMFELNKRFKTDSVAMREFLKSQSTRFAESLSVVILDTLNQISEASVVNADAINKLGDSLDGETKKLGDLQKEQLTLLGTKKSSAELTDTERRKYDELSAAIDAQKRKVAEADGVLKAATKSAGGQLVVIDKQIIASKQRVESLKNEIAELTRKGESEDKIAALTARLLTEEAALAALTDTRNKTASKSLEDLNRAARLMAAGFNAAVKQGMGWIEAINAMGKPLDGLIAGYQALGAELPDSIAELAHFRQLVADNKPLVDSATAINEVALALSNIGGLTVETLADIEAQGLDTYKRLTDAGFSETQSLMQMKGWLETIRDAHKQLGTPIDENTAKLLAQAEANGILADESNTTNGILKEGIGALIDALGGKLPEAWRKSADAAKAAAGTMASSTAAVASGVGGIAGQLDSTPWDRWASKGRSAVDGVADSVDGLNFGASPGGLKEIPLLMEAGLRAVSEFSAQAGAAIGGVKDKVDDLTGTKVAIDVATTRTIRDPGEQVLENQLKPVVASATAGLDEAMLKKIAAATKEMFTRMKEQVNVDETLAKVATSTTEMFAKLRNQAAAIGPLVGENLSQRVGDATKWAGEKLNKLYDDAKQAGSELKKLQEQGYDVAAKGSVEWNKYEQAVAQYNAALAAMTVGSKEGVETVARSTDLWGASLDALNQKATTAAAVVKDLAAKGYDHAKMGTDQWNQYQAAVAAADAAHQGNRVSGESMWDAISAAANSATTATTTATATTATTISTKFGIAWKAASDAAQIAVDRIGTATGGLFSRIDGIGSHLGATPWRSWADDAVDAATRAAGAIDTVSFGSSPGGIKEIPLQLALAMRAATEFATLFGNQMAGATDAVTDTANAAKALTDLDTAQAQVADLQQSMVSNFSGVIEGVMAAKASVVEAMRNTVQGAEMSLPTKLVATAFEPDAAMQSALKRQLDVQQQMLETAQAEPAAQQDVNITIQSWDSEDVAKRGVPQIIRALKTNSFHQTPKFKEALGLT